MADGFSAFPGVFQNFVVSTGYHDVEGHAYPFLVLNGHPRPQPSYFCGWDRETGLLFISDEVCPDYRPHRLSFEVYRNVHFDKAEDQYVQALRRELAELNGLDRAVYQRDRLETLLHLTRHVNDRRYRELYHPVERIDVSMAYTYLHSLIDREKS